MEFLFASIMVIAGWSIYLLSKKKKKQKPQPPKKVVTSEDIATRLSKKYPITSVLARQLVEGKPRLSVHQVEYLIRKELGLPIIIIDGFKQVVAVDGELTWNQLYSETHDIFDEPDFMDLSTPICALSKWEYRMQNDWYLAEGTLAMLKRVDPDGKQANNMICPKHRQSTHPGEILKKDFYPSLDNSAIKRLKEKVPELDKLIEGEAPVTKAIAAWLSFTFGTTRSFWMNLQKNYDKTEKY